jgi:hypothetical protein
VLDAQCHDRVDYIVVVLFEGLDGLLPADVGLGHDEFNVLVLDTLGVDLLVVILLLLSGLLAVAVVVAGVVVVVGGAVGELLSSGCLGTSVQVLDLSLAEDAVVMLVAASRVDHVVVGKERQTCRCCCWATCTPRGC